MLAASRRNKKQTWLYTARIAYGHEQETTLRAATDSETSGAGKRCLQVEFNASERLEFIILIVLQNRMRRVAWSQRSGSATASKLDLAKT